MPTHRTILAILGVAVALVVLLIVSKDVPLQGQLLYETAIAPPASCGNGICDGEDSCERCVEDCGDKWGKEGGCPKENLFCNSGLCFPGERPVEPPQTQSSP